MPHRLPASLTFMLYPVFLWSITALFFACADPILPTGGKKDDTPPLLDSSRYSTPNRQTNFKDKEIILTFKEWIQLKDAQKQILLSPPMATPPKVFLKHKSVVLRWTDTLRTNTTYTINFGNAIADITETNIVKDFRFVFSTGAALDSLRTTGKIVDTQTGQPKADVWVMLYDRLEDSIPAKERPYYCARTNKEGQFVLENLKADTFQIFALEDKNNDYLYNQPNEQIGFWKEPFVLSDSVQPFIQMRLFPPVQPLRVQNQKLLHQGALTLLWNRPPLDSLDLRPLNAPYNARIYTESGADTAKIWITGAILQDSTYTWAIYDGAQLMDTLWLRHTATSPKAVLRSFVPTGANTAAKDTRSAGNTPTKTNTPRPHHPLQPILIHWNLPLESLDTGRCLVLDDSISRPLAPAFQFNPAQPTRLQLNYTWQPKHTYQLYFLPGALTDFYGKTNPDTIHLVYTVQTPEDYGSIVANIVLEDSSRYYQLDLLSGNQVLYRHNIYQKKVFQHTYPQLPPGAYTLRLLHDANGNGRWDGGDYWLKQQPEVYTNSNPIQLRANWENEMEINLDPAFQPDTPKEGNTKDKSGKIAPQGKGRSGG